MNIQELVDSLVKETNSLKERVNSLERKSIQVNIDPVIQKYLDDAVGRQIYASRAPTALDIAPKTSIWIYDTGTTSTCEIHVYDGATWKKIK